MDIVKNKSSARMLYMFQYFAMLKFHNIERNVAITSLLIFVLIAVILVNNTVILVLLTIAGVLIFCIITIAVVQLFVFCNRWYITVAVFFYYNRHCIALVFGFAIAAVLYNVIFKLHS